MKNQSWESFNIAYEKWHCLYEQQRMIALSVLDVDKETFLHSTAVIKAFNMNLYDCSRKEIEEYLKDCNTILKTF